MTTKQAARHLLKLLEKAAREPKPDLKKVKALKIAVYVMAGVHSKGCAACTARLECVEHVLGSP